MLMGAGGFEFVEYTYTGSSNHTLNPGILENGCASCHMGEQSDDLGTGNAGGHTMKITWVPREKREKNWHTSLPDVRMPDATVRVLRRRIFRDRRLAPSVHKPLFTRMLTPCTV
jgi:hypothetical protein